jgi:hypothetical protein
MDVGIEGLKPAVPEWERGEITEELFGVIANTKLHECGIGITTSSSAVP